MRTCRGSHAKARLGTRVRQGQTIGYVGKTGLATGQHLHYEYRLNGVHRNPRTVSLPEAEPIAEQVPGAVPADGRADPGGTGTVQEHTGCFDRVTARRSV